MKTLWKTYLIGLLAGLVLLFIGAEMNGAAMGFGGGATPGAPLIAIAIVLILWLPVAGVILLAVMLARTVIAYGSWKKTLTLRQLTAVHSAEAVALLAAHEILKPHARAREQHQRITDSIVQGTPWNPS